MASLREVYATVIRAGGQSGVAQDEHGVQHAIRHDRDLVDGETIKLVLDENGAFVRVLEVPR